MFITQYMAQWFVGELKDTTEKYFRHYLLEIPFLVVKNLYFHTPARENFNS